MRKGQAAWLPIILHDKNGNIVPGQTYADVTVKFKQDNDTSLTTKTLTVTNFREIGEGMYEVYFSGANLNANVFRYVAYCAAGVPRWREQVLE